MRNSVSTGAHDGRGAGFSVAGVLFLILLVGAFLFGVVWLADQSVVSPDSCGGRGLLDRTAEDLLGRLEAISACARQVNVSADLTAEESGRWASRLDLLADLDGEDGGGFAVGEAKGLERVVVARAYPEDRLQALAYDGPGSPPSTARLPGRLAPGVDSFRVAYLAGGFSGAGARGVRFTVELTEGGIEGVYSRNVMFTHAPVPSHRIER